MPVPPKKPHRGKKPPTRPARPRPAARRTAFDAIPPYQQPDSDLPEKPVTWGDLPAPMQGDAQDDVLFADVLSGIFDDTPPEHTPTPDKRVLLPQPESPKLHKVLAQAGIGSRLEMEALISQGRIQVNGQAAHVGQRIQYGDSIKIDGRPVRVRIAPPLPRVLAYHKPVGELVTHDDPQHRPTVFRTLPRLHHGKWQAVGRLDLNTEGLLLITSSGELANQLMHPRFGLQREYAVRALGALTEAEKQRLLDGVELEDGIARFGSVEAGGGEGVNQWYKVTISEGRNREVRRMFEAVGHAVSRLIRIRYGMLHLPRGLRRGAWIELGERDVKALMEAAGLHESKGMAHVRRQEQNQRPQRGSPDRALKKAPRPSRPAARPDTQRLARGTRNAHGTHGAQGTYGTRSSAPRGEWRSDSPTARPRHASQASAPRWADEAPRHTRRPQSPASQRHGAARAHGDAGRTQFDYTQAKATHSRKTGARHQRPRK